MIQKNQGVKYILYFIIWFYLQISSARIARSIVVPTNENDIKAKLRELYEPITLFGENIDDRRERLQILLARIATTTGEIEAESILTYHAPRSKAEMIAEERKKMEQIKLKAELEETGLIAISEGSNQLLIARKKIATYSLEKSKNRISLEKSYRTNTELSQSNVSVLDSWLEKVKTVAPILSNRTDSRPLSTAAINSDNSEISTSGWAGLVSQYDFNGKSIRSWLAHNDRVVDLIYYGNQNEILATGSVDRTIRVWNPSINISEPIATLSGHFDRISKLEYHPSGYLLSGSFDCTFRMWDITTNQNVLIQDGHAKGISSISLHPDGSLLSTADLGGICRLFDLRTGKAIFDMKRHIKQVNCSDWHRDGWTLATGSEDGSVCIWDIRSKKISYSIPAHGKIITSVKFQKQGAFLLTSSFDNSIKFFSCKDWGLLNTLTLHEDKVASVTISEDSKFLVSTCFDKSWKLWGI